MADDPVVHMPGALPAHTPDGQARRNAMGAYGTPTEATSLIDFHSKGRLLIIGPAAEARSAAARLGDQLRCAVIAEPGPEAAGAEHQGDPAASNEVRARISELHGYLGAFHARLDLPNRSIDAAELLLGETAFDLVLDLGERPWLAYETPPVGYYAPGSDSEALEKALAELPELVGEFEKPKYFDYDPNICAHGNRGQQACTRCLDACPTQAIQSLGETIEVDPHLCQGAGVCATVCPTGAISYTYPPVADALGMIRKALRTYRDGGGNRPCVVFHDAEAGATTFWEQADDLPENVLPFQVEEIGSVGMDTWLTALAYGAHQVVVLVHSQVPPSVRAAVQEQIGFAQAILEGMGYSGARVVTVNGEELHATLSGFEDTDIEPGAFAGFNQKRTTLRWALDHLYEQAPAPRVTAPLPAGAPFGEILVDRDACTLCMACVSICPANALADSDERPQLRFQEEKCVQCGLCETACPEDAIRLSPRMAYDRQLASELRVLHEETPFHCLRCGKAFATQSMMDRMREKLAGHWMFQSEDALRRLQMCEECRVKDMYEHEGLIDVHGSRH